MPKTAQIAMKRTGLILCNIVFCQVNLYGVITVPDSFVIHSVRFERFGFLFVLYRYFAGEWGFL